MIFLSLILTIFANMKKTRLVPALLCAAMLSQPLAAGDKGALRVTPVAQDADAANGGIVYALPQTVLRIRLTAQVVVSSVGPFFQYSTRFLNLTDVVTENSTRWTLVGAEIETAGRADFSRRYKVSAQEGGTLPKMSLTADGVLVAVNADAESADRAPEDCGVPSVAYATFAEVPLSQSVLSRTAKAAMAEECAQTVYALRDARVGIVSGSADARMADAGSMAMALAEIDRLERQHVEMFAGRRDTLTVSRVVEVVPDYNGASNVVPLRFSATSGFADAMDLNGKPIYVDMEFDNSARVNEYAPGSKQRNNAPLNGLFHILPGNVNVRVMDRNILLVQKSVRCTQNGQVACLPASQMGGSRIVLDAATGAIVSIAPIETKK